MIISRGFHFWDLLGGLGEEQYMSYSLFSLKRVI